ncbi:MAG TPA: hypothetical protein VIF62_04375 [Labilithrix sp.]
MRIGSTMMTISGVALVAAIGSSCNLDPVHRAGVNNLGPENSDAYPPESEFHRPGEPCALCHSSEGPADSIFVLAGTVFWGPDDYNRRADSVYVRVIDGAKRRKCFVTNCNGNFFAKPEDFPKSAVYNNDGPVFPLLVSVERVKDPGKDETTLQKRVMNSHIGREASCATCHIQGLRDFGSPGQIRLYDNETDSKTNAPDNVIVPCPPPPEHLIVGQCPEDRE